MKKYGAFDPYKQENYNVIFGYFGDAKFVLDTDCEKAIAEAYKQGAWDSEGRLINEIDANEYAKRVMEE